jgi:hypothetical protein
MTITYRAVKGSNLTAAEVDANFSQLAAAVAATSTAVSVQDEGVTLSTAAQTLNFVGAGVVASGTDVVKTITIPGGGITTLVAATDFGTAALPTGNAPLVAALGGKADALSVVILGAGPTAVTRASHLNRPCTSAQAGATSIVFAAAATSGAQAGDAFEVLNTGAGTMTASGAVTAAAGYKLTAVTGETFTCGYSAATDSFYSTTPSSASSFSGGTLTTALNEAPAVTLASGATVAIGAAGGNTITVSGTTTITAFDTIASGAIRCLVFSGILTLTHNAATLILPGGASIITAAGDAAEFLSLGAGNWRCIGYTRATGAALVAGAGLSTCKVIAVSNVPYPVTPVGANINSYCVASIPLPILNANTRIDVDTRWINTSTGSKIMAVLLSATAATPGSTGSTAGSNIHVASTASIFLRVLSGFTNLASVSSQFGGNDVLLGQYGQSALANRTASINTGVVSYINIYVTTPAGSDTAQLQGYTVTAYDPVGL